MKKFIGLGMAVILAAVFVISLTGCSPFYHITGSKDIETRQFDYTGFTKIEVSSAFDVTVTRSDTYSVGVTLNENIFDDLNVSMSGDTLKISLNSFAHFIDVTQKVDITLPELDSLSITGACEAAVTGFQSNGNLALSVTGASGMQLNNLQAADTTIKIIGASHLSGSLTANNADLSVTGVSHITLSGSASTMKLSVLGTSDASLANFVVAGDASVTAEGVSDADIEVHGTLNINLSGVSTLTYGDDPKLGKVSVSGVSNLNRR
jgi:Putative auto-transporter adhesin, head GIN domain